MGAVSLNLAYMLIDPSATMRIDAIDVFILPFWQQTELVFARLII
jgi:hypothetical protein